MTSRRVSYVKIWMAVVRYYLLNVKQIDANSVSNVVTVLFSIHSAIYLVNCKLMSTNELQCRHYLYFVI